MDRSKHTIERCLSNGESHLTIHTGLRCIWPLTLDYDHQKIYWTDYCDYTVESLDINGTNHTIAVSGEENLVIFSNGITYFEGVVYWTQPMNVFMLSGDHVSQIHESSSSQIQKGIQVVHPRSQPTGKTDNMYI